MSEDELTRFCGPSAFLRTSDGRRLHHRTLLPATPVRTPAPPTVVWVAGMGTSGLSWAGLHHRVAATHPSVIVDRAGLGRSDDDDQAPTTARAGDDLTALIDALGGRVLLVAHSWGGPLARVAAARRPDAVHGLVLVDPSDEHLRDPALGLPARGRPPHPLALRVSRLALARHAARTLRSLEDPRVPAAVTREMRREHASARAARTHARELAVFDDELDRLRAAPPASPGVPTTLLTGTLIPRSGPARRRRQAMHAAHLRSAAAAPRIRLVPAARSGHLIPFSEPDLVYDEVVRALG